MSHSVTPNMITSLEAIAGNYDVILCDVWGVLHNGVGSFEAAGAALVAARAQGLKVVLITNAPRPSPDVIVQMKGLGVPDEAYDRVVTSGDVTRHLISNGPRKVFHIGEDRDLSLYDGLDVELVEEQEAQVIVCTGLFDDKTERPEDYEQLLLRLRSRDIPMICANPDIVVERGDQLIWCAGALARDYGLLGGRTMIAGKPHRPIYDEAIQVAGELLGREVDHDRVLAIGDAMLTDVKGAVDYGLDILFVSAGIHSRDYGVAHDPDIALLGKFLSGHGTNPTAILPFLR